MPKGSKELTAARREEIIDACAELYEDMPFRDITIGRIAELTSFSRTSIYNYFGTREEIFLALLAREYAAWTADLNALAEDGSDRPFPLAFASLLEKRRRMLKLLSMNIYDMESGSSLRALTAFKEVYKGSLGAVERCLKAHFPDISDEGAQQFIYALYPFLFGVYPYTSATPKQIAAMDAAGVKYRIYTVTQIVASLTEKLLKGLV